MAEEILQSAGLEKWQNGLADAIKDAKWAVWDCEIQLAVNEYNRHLAGTAGYFPLDWQLIKAMLWVETGAASTEWKTKPMQIGVPGDPGLTSFLSGNEGGELILPPRLKVGLSRASVRTIPTHNIRAGIGYLLMRMANFKYQTVVSEDKRIHELSVRLGDSLGKLAKAHGTTIDMLSELNPGTAALRPGHRLKYRKASVQRVIVGWRHISTASIAMRYNGGGDPNYAKKLDHALNLVRNGSTAPCV